jgi:hypothetical protein
LLGATAATRPGDAATPGDAANKGAVNNDNRTTARFKAIISLDPKHREHGERAGCGTTTSAFKTVAFVRSGILPAKPHRDIEGAR